MIKSPTNTDDDLLWLSLNDASRRKMIDLLRDRSMTTGQLCEHFDFSRFAVMKHLKVLEKGGLIIVERVGRDRINHLNPTPIRKMYRRWIRKFEEIPADRMLKIKRLSEQVTG